MSEVYVSITGLKIKRGWPTLRFWWLTVPAMRQAKSAPGNISADARLVDGVMHTLSVWESKAAMRAYMLKGAHKRAMLATRSIGTGSTHGYDTAAAPDWTEALSIWRQFGRVV